MISNLDNAEGSKNFVWTREKLIEFKKVFEIASKNHGDNAEFIYDNHVFVVGYAKYLIQFMESALKQ